MKKLILALTCLFFAIPCSARTIIVDANGTGDYPTIQAAINDANDGDTVELQPGTYTGIGNRDIDFLGKAITVRSIDPNDPSIVDNTIIDCGWSGRGFYFHSGEGANSILEGFTIEYGYLEEFEPIGGAGICIRNSSPTIGNCIIQWNMATAYSGPISAVCGAGGIAILGDSRPTIADCVITYNMSEWKGYGGGICCGSSTHPTIRNCIISENQAFHGYGGGGIYCVGDVAIDNCIISKNSATGDVLGIGGGIYCDYGSSIKICNCTITENTADRYGGGIYFYYYMGPPIDHRMTIANSIIWGNSPDQIYIKEGGGTGAVTFSDIEGGWPGTGNIDAEPCFVDASNGDYHLKSQAGRWDPNSQTWVQDTVTSPAIDAGDPNSDWSAEPQPNGGRINMGAYGGANQASKSLGCFPIDHPDYDIWVDVGCPPCWCYPRQCHGDTDNQVEGGTKTGYYYVHLHDLELLVSAWNIMEPPPSTPYPPGIKWPDPNICADFDHDIEGCLKCGYNRVHFNDLVILLSSWNILEPASPPVPSGPGIDPNCLGVP